MTRPLLLCLLGLIAWHWLAPQLGFAADLWRDVQDGLEKIWGAI